MTDAVTSPGEPVLPRIHVLFLVILTAAGCVYSFLLSFAVSWETSGIRYFPLITPAALALMNLCSIPLYLSGARTYLKYAYNICLTVIVLILTFSVGIVPADEYKKNEGPPDGQNAESSVLSERDAALNFYNSSQNARSANL